MTVEHSLQVSASLAITGGILLPLLETIRRWEQMSEIEYFTYWFDDYLIGGFLLCAGWRTLRSRYKGLRILCAAWGAATVMLILSFIGQLIHIGNPDPAPVSPVLVAVIKGLLLAGALTGLILALRSSPFPIDRDQAT